MQHNNNNRPLKDKILTRRGQRRWRAILARAKKRGKGDEALLERDEYGNRVRVAKRPRINALAKESEFEPRADTRGFEAMMQATEHITSEDEGEAAAAAAAAAETSRWKRFEPEIKTLHRLAEHTSKTKEPGNLTGTNKKKFSFVTAKFVHFETVHTKKAHC